MDRNNDAIDRLIRESKKVRDDTRRNFRLLREAIDKLSRHLEVLAKQIVPQTGLDPKGGALADDIKEELDLPD